MYNIEEQYLKLLKDVLDNGIQKGDRTGTGTLSVFGRQLRHSMSAGFPLLTTKKVAWQTMKTELQWFLMGGTNIKFLVDNDCHIWVGDALKAYRKWEADDLADFLEKNPLTLVDFQYTTKEEFINKIKTDAEFANKWGDLGPIYGKQWRRWEVDYDTSSDYLEDWHVVYIDQIDVLMKTLRDNPDSRRMMVNAWNVSDLDEMVLPPCHYGFQVWTRELTIEERRNYYKNSNKFNKETYDHIIERSSINSNIESGDWDSHNIPKRSISLMWNQRSVDLPLGLPFNIASYGLLLELIANEMNMVADELIANLGDCHIYLNQIDGVKEQITRQPLQLPTVKVKDGIYSCLVDDSDDVQLIGYEHHPPIKFPLSN